MPAGETPIGDGAGRGRVAFIGLGNMGGPMALNLVKGGYEVGVYDLSAQARARLAEGGARAAEAIAAAVQGASAVVTMLPADRHVQEAYLGEGGICAHAPPGALLIECSTISVDAARSLAEAAGARGFSTVDAPVSGGVAAAAGASLTFMVGGADEAFARAEPILQTMGKAVIHAGGPGAGQAAKICNNMLLGASMIATAEAFILAEKLGLSAQTFFDISSKASGQCWSMTSYCPAPGPVPTAPSNRGYAPGFAAAMMLKDLKLAQAAAASVGAATPMGAQAEALYQLYAANGGAQMDFSGVYQLLKGAQG
jgi:3-hydroxyisobutyrate dehydrogenase